MHFSKVLFIFHVQITMDECSNILQSLHQTSQSTFSRMVIVHRYLMTYLLFFKSFEKLYRQYRLDRNIGRYGEQMIMPYIIIHDRHCYNTIVLKTTYLTFQTGWISLPTIFWSSEWWVLWIEKFYSWRKRESNFLL